MDVLKQNIAEIDSAIIVARQWLKEAETDQDTGRSRPTSEEEILFTDTTK